MNETVKEYLEDFMESTPLERFEKLNLYNTSNFIGTLRRQGVDVAGMLEFFRAVCRIQIGVNGPLPTNGYYDLIRFSRDEGLFPEQVS